MYLRNLCNDLGFTYYPKFLQKCRNVAELTGTNLEDYRVDKKRLLNAGISTKLRTEYDVPLEFAIAVTEHTLITNPNRATVLANLYKEKGVAVVTTALPRKEIRFAAELYAYLSVLGIVMETQKYVGTYRVDMYLPEHNLVIEYDENHHTHEAINIEDVKRAQYLHETIGCTILRVPETMMLGEALAYVQKQLGTKMCEPK